MHLFNVCYSPRGPTFTPEAGPVTVSEHVVVSALKVHVSKCTVHTSAVVTLTNKNP